MGESYGRLVVINRNRSYHTCRFQVERATLVDEEQRSLSQQQELEPRRLTQLKEIEHKTRCRMVSFGACAKCTTRYCNHLMYIEHNE